ncbi:MAG: BTAD domain-containing putative transcriptional regulator [Gordonia sp. (in: high G+C Gram-positive bacteria)]
MEFLVLGPLEVRSDGGEVIDLGTPKQRALIAALVAHAPHAVSVDALIDVVWGETPPASVLSTLHAYISGLRRVLEPERGRREPARLLITQAPGYRLAVQPGDVDAARFTETVARVGAALEQPELLDGEQLALLAADLEAASSLWRGEPYVEVPEAPQIAVQRSRLQDLRVTASQLKAEILLAQGNEQEAVTVLDALIAEHPLRENLWALRATALVRTGRQAEALAGLRELRDVLDAELGLEPGPAVVELNRRILNQDPELTAPRRVVERSGTPAPSESEAPAVAGAGAAGRPGLLWPTVERTAELAVLGGAWERAAGGATEFVVITGDPGIGKSRLAVEAAQLASGGTVVIARCSQDDGAPALWPWRQILDRVGCEPPQGSDAFAVRQHVVEQLRTVAARTPLLVVVDDLHWADPSSLRVIQLITETCDADRLMLVLTWRSSPEPAGLLAEVSEALGRRHAHRLSPRGLSADGVAEMVAAVTRLEVTGGQATLLADRTDGNPFFVSEYARLADQSGDLTGVLTAGDPPTAVSEVIRRRLDRLPESARDVLRAGSVLGRDFDLETLAAVTDLSVDDALDLVEPICALGLLREVGVEQYLFFHALVRDVVYGEQPATRRARRHARIAQILTDAGKEPSEIARHWLAAGPAHTERAWRAAVVAAEAADALFAHEDALVLRRAALAILDADPHSDPADRYAVLLGLAESQRQLGDWTAATDSAGRAIALATDLGDAELLARAAVVPSWGATWYSVNHGASTPSTVVALRSALDRLPPGDSRLRVETMLALASETYYARETIDRGALIDDAVAMACRLDDPQLLLEASLRAQQALVSPYTTARRLELVTAAIDLATRLDDSAALLQARVAYAVLCSELGLVDERRTARDQALALARRLRQPFPQFVLDSMEVSWLAMSGEFEAAWRLVDEVRGLAERITLEQGTDAVIAAIASVMFWDGSIAERLDELADGTDWQIPNTCSVAVFFARAGRPADAKALMEYRGVDLTEDWWFSSVEWGSAAELALHLGDPELAADAYRRLLPIAGRCATSGSSGACGPVDAYLAFAAAATGDVEQAGRHAADAVELIERWQLPAVRRWFDDARARFGF